MKENGAGAVWCRNESTRKGPDIYYLLFIVHTVLAHLFLVPILVLARFRKRCFSSGSISFQSVAMCLERPANENPGWSCRMLSRTCMLKMKNAVCERLDMLGSRSAPFFGGLIACCSTSPYFYPVTLPSFPFAADLSCASPISSSGARGGGGPGGGGGAGSSTAPGMCVWSKAAVSHVCSMPVPLPLVVIIQVASVFLFFFFEARSAPCSMRVRLCVWSECAPRAI
jgi:hypothetical protein